VKGREIKWRTYERIVRGRSRVEGGKSRGEQKEAMVRIDGFSVQIESKIGGESADGQRKRVPDIGGSILVGAETVGRVYARDYKLVLV